MTALLIGAVLAVAALLYVLFPLFDLAPSARPRQLTRSAAPSDSAIDALREIEFDRATGKLSDDDYASLKAEYTRTALVEMRARQPIPEPVGDDSTRVESTIEPPNGGDAGSLDAAEAAVLRYRSVRRACETCGPRPEPDPAFCSSCGKYLKGACTHCGAAIDKPASRFCGNCGSSLAA